jgi:hypothetical protein
LLQSVFLGRLETSTSTSAFTLSPAPSLTHDDDHLFSSPSLSIEKTKTKQKRSSSKAEQPVVIRKQSFLEAFDFSAARSDDDAILIAKARGMRKGQKMSPEQYQALRRKVGGTAKDYWKGWVDVKGNYVDKVRFERERGRLS